MHKTIILILNIIAASPIVIYPVMLFTSIMVFDAPGSENSYGKIFTALLMIGFPILIGVCIFLSQKYHSLVWALVACVPFFFLLYSLVIQDFIADKRHEKAAAQVTQNLSRDFIYDSVLANKLAREQGGFIGDVGSFFTIDVQNNQIIKINPTAPGAYFADPVGKIKDNTLEVSVDDIETAKQAYSAFVNKDNKSIFDVYTVVNKKGSRGEFEDSFNLEKFKLKE